MAREASSDPDIKTSNIDAKMWAVSGSAFFACEESVKELPPAQYTIVQSQDRGIFFNKKEINLDDLMTLPDSASQLVLKEIETFWTKEDQYRKFKFLWKRGILLWGPPGSGKTSTVQLISKLIVDRGGISVYVSSPKLAAFGLEMMRKIEPKRPIVVMLEDLDAIISGNHGAESDLLALLDGELQIDNVVFIATTNYPEKLDRRIVNRPSRFDLVKKIGMPSADARRMYILAKEPDSATNVIEIVDEDSIRAAESMRERAGSDLADAVSGAKELMESLAGARDRSAEANSRLEVAKLESDQASRSLEALMNVGANDAGAMPLWEAQTVVARKHVDIANANVAKLEAKEAELLEIYQSAADRLKKIEADGRRAADDMKAADDMEAKARRSVREVDHWVEQTDGFSVAHIKELILAIRCFEQPFADVIRRLKAMSKPPSSSDRDGMFSR